MDIEAVYEERIENILEAEDDEVIRLTQELIDAGEKPADIINKGLLGGMDIISEQFKTGEAFIPEVLLTAETVNIGLAMVKPLLKEGEVEPRGKVVVGTVEGDVHNIGKNIVAMMLESKGYQIIDLDCEVPDADFVETALRENADILGMSSLLTTSMNHMKTTIELAKEKGLGAKIIIGGAPVSRKYAEVIGADGYSADGGSAVTLCDTLMGLL